MAFLAPLAAPLALAGAATSAVGTIGSGIAQGNAAGYAAQVAQNNAVIAQQNAQYATEAGEARAGIASLRGAGQVAHTKAAQAAGGIDVNTGSAVDVRASQREQGQLTSETELNNAVLQAYGYRSQATGFQAQAGLEEAEATEAPLGGIIGGVGSLLSNASGISTKWGAPGTAAPSGSSNQLTTVGGMLGQV